jgi:hypothetical protein
LAEDGLPTATMDVEGERLPVKLDSGARYSVAGTDWMLRGERALRPAPVDVVEGIGGFTLDVLGVWTFNMRNAFGQAVSVEACIIDGCTDEFLVGVDFLQRHKATMDFAKNEVRYDEKEQQVVMPFRTESGDGSAKVAAVRLVGDAQCSDTCGSSGGSPGWRTGCLRAHDGVRVRDAGSDGDYQSERQGTGPHDQRARQQDQAT